MEKLTPLLEKLAQQLGTTVQHLWTVLIAQARIEFIFYIVEYIICFSLFGIWIWVLSKTLKPCQYTDTDHCREPIIRAFPNKWLLWDYKHDEWVFEVLFLYGVPGLILIIWFLACISSMGLAASALLNPEYWALKKVLSIIK